MSASALALAAVVMIAAAAVVDHRARTRRKSGSRLGNPLAARERPPAAEDPAEREARRRADEALAASERRFRAVFDSGFQFETLVDLNGRVLETNAASLRFAGATIDDVRDRLVWDTLWWARSAAAGAELRTACEEARAGATVAYQVDATGADGHAATLDVSLKPISNDDGEVTQILAEARDVTDRKRAEAALRELDTLASMARVAGRVAHDINNPLAGIQNSFLLIKDAIPSTHPYYAYVAAIENEITRIASVTRQLYETFRETDGRPASAPIVIVLQDTIRMLERVNRDEGVRITLDTTELPAVMAVPGELVRQIVCNLIQDGIDASPRGSCVAVRASRSADGLRLSVRDWRTPAIADLATAAPTSRRGRVPDDRLGIGFARRAATALGGRIDISDPDDGGAEFIVTVPIAAHYGASDANQGSHSRRG